MKVASVTLVVLALVEAAFASGARTPSGNEESWSPDCAELVAKAPRIGGDIKVPVMVKRSEPVSNLKKWNLPCPGVTPIFELLVDEFGKVRCVRIIQLTRGRPPDGLYNEVHANLRKMTFKPATLHGKPTPVIMSVTIVYKCQ